MRKIITTDNILHSKNQGGLGDKEVHAESSHTCSEIIQLQHPSPATEIYWMSKDELKIIHILPGLQRKISKVALDVMLAH